MIPRMKISGATSDHGWTYVFISWVVASIATLGALFLGEIMGYTPCVLCWYQRISMFPLVLILATGLFPFDIRVVRYALPLSVVGWLLAVFHWGVASGFIPESVTPCTQGVPCSTELVRWFGFVTIPLLSVFAFSIINALLLLTYFREPK
jgi:disulfide bond formation protein DsbB